MDTAITSQLRPDFPPVLPQLLPRHCASAGLLNAHAQAGRWLTTIAALSKLAQVHGADADQSGKSRPAAVWESIEVGLQEVHVMHYAYRQQAQQAYRPRGSIGTMQDVGINLRRDRRHARLNQLIDELTASGMTEGQIAATVKTQRSYLAAMKAGTRGVGDALAARLEKEFARPEGWMDQPFEDHEASKSKSVADAMAVIVGALGAADDLARIKVAGLLSRLADAQHVDRLRFATALVSELEPPGYNAVTWESVCRSTVDAMADTAAKDVVVAFLQLVDERYHDLVDRKTDPTSVTIRRT